MREKEVEAALVKAAKEKEWCGSEVCESGPFRCSR